VTASQPSVGAVAKNWNVEPVGCSESAQLKKMGRDKQPMMAAKAAPEYDIANDVQLASYLGLPSTTAARPVGCSLSVVSKPSRSGIELRVPTVAEVQTQQEQAC
jgi:hypothetical protein